MVARANHTHKTRSQASPVVNKLHLNTSPTASRQLRSFGFNPGTLRSKQDGMGTVVVSATVERKRRPNLGLKEAKQSIDVVTPATSNRAAGTCLLHGPDEEKEGYLLERLTKC